MSTSRLLLLSALLAVSLPVGAAQGPNSILGHVQGTSFFIDAPAGWNTDQQAAQRFRAIFVLTPPGTNFNNAGAVLVGSSYVDTTVTDAMNKVKASTRAADPAAEITEPEALQVGSVKIPLVEIRSKVIRSQPFESIAFMPLGKHVFVLTLSALAETPHTRGREVFLEMLKTYAEAGVEVRTGQ